MKLVILGRDGVINQAPDDHIKSPEEWSAIPGSLEAISRLNHAGYRVAVISNQAGIAKNKLAIDTLNTIHQKMLSELNHKGGHLDAILFCPHGINDQCSCHKPAPGLLQSIEERFQTSLEGIPVIGDSLHDIQAARSVLAQPILVRTGRGESTLLNYHDQVRDIPIFDDLASTVASFLG